MKILLRYKLSTDRQGFKTSQNYRNFALVALAFFFVCLVPIFPLRAQAPVSDAPAEDEALFREARRLYLEKNFESALSKLQEASSIDKDNSAVWMLMGKAQEQLDRNNEAQISFGMAATTLQKELKAVKDHKARRVTLLRILQTISQLEDIPDETLEYIAQFRQLDPDSSPYVEALAVRAHFQQAHYEKVTELGGKLLDKKTKGVNKQQMHYFMAESAYQLEKYELAGEHYQQMESEMYLKKLAHLNPERFYHMGYAYFFFYDWEKSHEYLQRALLMRPDYTRARVFFNNVIKEEANKQEAIKHSHTRIIQIDERVHDAKYYGDLTRLYLLEENYRKAVVAADSCLSINPDYLESQYLQGIAYYKKHENDEAIATFESLVQKSEGIVKEEKKYQYYFALGMAYNRAEPEKAPAAFRQARHGIYKEAAEHELKKLHTYSQSH